MNSDGKNERLHLLKTASSSLEEWFRLNGRRLPWRENAMPYGILVSETMLQQTRIETVLRYYPRFIKRFPDPASLAEAEEGEVLKYWEGLGYYSRARNLKKAAEVCTEKYAGGLPRTAEALRTLPGVGDYTAGAVASIAFGEAVPAVDGNVLRVLARFFNDERDVRQSGPRKEAAELLREVLSERPAPGLFNEALMELGELICLPNTRPSCRKCPWKDYCLGLKAGTEADLPVRGAQAPRRTENKTVLILRWKDKIALEKRPDKGLLAGLYGFPLLDGSLDLTDIRPWLDSYKTAWSDAEYLGEAVQLFTHVQWHMRGWAVRTEDPLPGYEYADRETLDGRTALPSAFRFFRKYCFENLS